MSDAPVPLSSDGEAWRRCDRQLAVARLWRQVNEIHQALNRIRRGLACLRRDLRELDAQTDRRPGKGDDR